MTKLIYCVITRAHTYARMLRAARNGRGLLGNCLTLVQLAAKLRPGYMGDVKKETMSGAKWTMLQKMTMQPVQFVYGVILARLISPEEFGIIGLTAIFFAIAAQLQSCGFGSALIRNIHRTERDINTVFWTNVVLSFLLSSILFCCAPLFVTFFHQPPLLWLTRASALMMFLNSTGSVHWTLYSCRRDFKTPAIIHTVCTLVAMPFTICAAYAGWSYWALMTQSILSSLLALITVWIVSPWRPSLIWSAESFRTSFSYGSRLMVKGIISAASANMRSLLVGKVYSPAALGLYSRSWNVAALPITTVNSMLGPVTFPILSTLQEDNERLLSVYSKYIRITSLALFFASCLLVALARPFITFVYGANWEACVVFVQILSFAEMSYHIGLINENLLLVKGRSDIALRVFIAKTVMHYVALVPALFVNMEVVCLSAVVVVPFGLWINTHYTSRLYQLSRAQQVADFMPYFILSILACLPSYLLTYLPLHPIVQMGIGGPVACLLYWAMLHFRKDSAYLMLRNTIMANPHVKRFFASSSPAA